MLSFLTFPQAALNIQFICEVIREWYIYSMYVLTLGACANVTDVVLIKWAGDEAIVTSSLGLLIGGRGREGLISTACACVCATYPYNLL